MPKIIVFKENNTKIHFYILLYRFCCLFDGFFAYCEQFQLESIKLPLASYTAQHDIFLGYEIDSSIHSA